MGRFKEIFSRKPEGMSRTVKWFFGLPLAFVLYFCIALIIPSFGTGNNSSLLRMATLEIVLIFCVLLVVKKFLNFDLKHFFTSDNKFSRKRFFVSFLIISVAEIITNLLLYLIFREEFEFTFIKNGFLSNVSCTLILILAAATAEELIFRSYIAFFFHDEPVTSLKDICSYSFVSGLLFAFFHFRNPEVSKGDAFWTMFFYFLFGTAMMFFFLSGNGIEIPLGLHIGNNLFSSLIVSYDNSVIRPNSVFIHHHNADVFLIIQTVLCLIICAVVLKKLNMIKEI